MDAARTLSDLAEIINHLWGHPTPGGRLYPAQVDRTTVALGWPENSGSTIAARAEDLTSSEEDDDRTWVVICAVYDDPDLFEFTARCVTTAFPAQYLWGPGTRAEAAAWLIHHQPQPDRCDYLDQVVLVPVRDDLVGLPVYPAVAAGLPATEQNGSWHAVRVDRPRDALGHVRAVMATGQGHNAAGVCRDCPAETVAVGDIATVLEAARNAGADTVPVTVPDVRTPFADRFSRSPV
nr:hypothetical protein [Streptomyces sp. TLI_235]